MRAVTGGPDATWDRFAHWAAVLSDLAGAAGLLGWDRETGMPPRGAETRASQLGTLAAIHHRELVREDAGDLLEALGRGGTLGPDEQAMVAWARRERDRAVRVPEALVRRLAEARSRAVTTWIDARERDDLATYVQAVRPVVALKRQVAEAVGGGAEPYDALLDEFEPGARAAELAPLFEQLTQRLRPLVEPAAAASGPALPRRSWPADAQMSLAREVAAAVGFDDEAGIIARSAHPFTGSPGQGDVRFTTRVNEHDPLVSLGAVLHEAGHALYEQGLPERYARTPLADAPSLGAHESQSLFWENHIGLQQGFWRYLEPALRRCFPGAMDGLGADAMAAAARRVEPSLIRVEADEVTYNLHIALRFELERGLMGGTLDVADLPEAFDDGMERLLGLRPPTAAVGVMQDIHWPEGLLGYFPTYTLGHLYAAQLAAAAEEEVGDLDALSAEGRFTDALAFLRERVHRHARTLPTRELMSAATGRELGIEHFLTHLEETYLLPA